MPSNPSKPADFIVDNASGSTVRGDINDIFDAIGRNNGYGSEPTTPLPYMWYANSQNGMMGVYKNPTSGGRLEFLDLNTGAFSGPNGTTTNPSFTFTNSTSTGFYRPNANQIGASCNGVASTIFKETGVDIAGDLIIQHAAGSPSKIEILAPAAGDHAFIDLVGDTTHADYGLRIRRLGGSSSTATDGPNNNSEILHKGSGSLHLNSQDSNSTILFSTVNLPRFQINANGSLIAQESSVLGSGSPSYNTLEIGTFQGRGFGCRTGLSNDSGNVINGVAQPSVNQTHLFNFFWDISTNNAFFFIDNTRLGHIDASTTSDYRIKRNVADLNVNGIERIKKLRPITYQHCNFGLYKQNDTVHEGFIAHEVGEVIPDACKGKKDEGLQIIGIAPIVATLTKALQEAVAKIEVLEAKVAALEAS